MVKVEKYIRISFTSIAIFFCYMMTFVSMPAFGIYTKLKYVMMLIVIAYGLFHYRELRCKWVTGPEKLMLFGYIVMSFVASTLNLADVVLRNPLIQCIGHCGILIANLMLLTVLRNTNKLNILLDYYWKLSLAVLVITDITVLLGMRYGSNYLIGTKFMVAYHHIATLLIFLIYAKEWNLKNRFILAVQLVLTLLINIYTGCATGILGTVFVLFLLLLFRREVKIVLHPITQVGALLACTAFPILYKPLLDNRLAHFIIEDVLHRKMNLTGRTRIYSRIPEIFGNHIVIGYGINTNTEYCNRWGFTNIQNGMLKVMMESGLVAMILLILFYFLVFNRAKKTDGKVERAISSYLLLMTLLSTIEITISLSTIAALLYLCVLTGYVTEMQKNEKSS